MLLLKVWSGTSDVVGLSKAGSRPHAGLLKGVCASAFERGPWGVRLFPQGSCGSRGLSSGFLNLVIIGSIWGAFEKNFQHLWCDLKSVIFIKLRS